MLHTSTDTPTQEEARWIRLVKKLGCLCCMQRGYLQEEGAPLVEAHHLLEGGIRRGHLFTVGLCKWHHRGELLVRTWDHKRHREKLGPALSEGSVPFHAEFGDDETLLQMQQTIIDTYRSLAYG